MTYLPEDDTQYLEDKGLEYALKTEPVAGGPDRQMLVISNFPVEGTLYARIDGQLVQQKTCTLLIVIPTGYSTARLDSWYTTPRLVRPDGTNPVNTDGDQPLLGTPWQFWSRHLGENDWRVGVDGLSTYLQFVRNAFKTG